MSNQKAASDRAVLLGILDLVTALAERLTGTKVLVCLRDSDGYPTPLQPDPNNVRWLTGEEAAVLSSVRPMGRPAPPAVAESPLEAVHQEMAQGIPEQLKALAVARESILRRAPLPSGTIELPPLVDQYPPIEVVPNALEILGQATGLLREDLCWVSQPGEPMITIPAFQLSFPYSVAVKFGIVRQKQAEKP